MGQVWIVVCGRIDVEYDNIQMSLLIVGSCSRVTQNIILALAKQNLYKKITIADLLPTYDFHRRQISDQKSQSEVVLDKIIKTDHLYHQIQGHDHVLSVTHDYFHSTTSKTRLMELTADFAKQKERLVFATPIEYDHYGFKNPEQNYLDSQQRIREKVPSATFLRSDVQDTSELYAYLYKSKNIWEQKLLQTPDSFKPKVVGAAFYAQQVVQALDGKYKGQVVSIRGERERHYTQVQHNREIEGFEIDHQVQNIRLLVSKYRGPQDKLSKLITFKF